MSDFNTTNDKDIKTVQFDNFAETYDGGLDSLLGSYVGGNNSYKFAEYKIQLLHFIFFKKSIIQNILDFGCGTGRSLLYLNQYFGNNSTYFGCDISSKSVSVAHNVFPEANLFVNTTIEDFDSQRTKYDLILL